jgi:hypothetical protein
MNEFFQKHGFWKIGNSYKCQYGREHTNINDFLPQHAESITAMKSKN